MPPVEHLAIEQENRLLLTELFDRPLQRLVCCLLVRAKDARHRMSRKSFATTSPSLGWVAMPVQAGSEQSVEIVLLGFKIRLRHRPTPSAGIVAWGALPGRRFVACIGLACDFHAPGGSMRQPARRSNKQTCQVMLRLMDIGAGDTNLRSAALPSASVRSYSVFGALTASKWHSRQAKLKS